MTGAGGAHAAAGESLRQPRSSTPFGLLERGLPPRWRAYLAFARNSFLKNLAYRTRYYVGVANYLVFVSVNCFVWQAVYDGRASGELVKGFSLREMTTYVTVAWIARSLYFSNSDYEMQNMVRTGAVTTALLRPVSFQGMLVYCRCLAQAVKGRLAYKGDFFALLAASLIVALSGLLFILVLVDGDKVPAIQGWRREELLVIFAVSSIAQSLFSLLAVNLWGFGGRYIIEGEFDRVLLRPMHTLGQVLFEKVNFESLGGLVVGVAAVLYAVRELGITLNWVDWLWLTVSVLSGAVILLSVFVAVASLSLHCEDRLGVSAPVYNMILFSRYPLPIFNSLIQFLLCWVFPFAFVGFFPSARLLGRAEYLFYCYLTPLVALAALTAAVLLWNLGVSRYSSVGN